MTTIRGAPTLAGPLAGVSLGLPVYHILEDVVREQVDPAVYKQQIGMMNMALPKELVATMREVRGQQPTA